jgi:hypothetical protein
MIWSPNFSLIFCTFSSVVLFGVSSLIPAQYPQALHSLERENRHHGGCSRNGSPNQRLDVAITVISAN